MQKVNSQIIGMCHFLQLPNDPNYCVKKGLGLSIDRAKNDLEVLQKNGIHKILFSNEFSYPYMKKLNPITPLSMAYLIGMLKKELSVPFGVDCMYDSYATAYLANATNADFCRITLQKSDLNSYIYGRTDIGEIIRQLKNYNYSNNCEIVLNVSEPLKESLINSNFNYLLSEIITQIKPQTICLSSNICLKLINDTNFIDFKNKYYETKFFCDGGCNAENISTILNTFDGAIIGKAFKDNEILNNPINSDNVFKIMKNVFN